MQFSVFSSKTNVFNLEILGNIGRYFLMDEQKVSTQKFILIVIVIH